MDLNSHRHPHTNGDGYTDSDGYTNPHSCAHSYRYIYAHGHGATDG